MQSAPYDTLAGQHGHNVLLAVDDEMDVTVAVHAWEGQAERLRDVRFNCCVEFRQLTITEAPEKGGTASPLPYSTLFNARSYFRVVGRLEPSTGQFIYIK